MYKILLLIILLIIGYAFLESGLDAALKRSIEILGIAIMISWLAFRITVGILRGFHLNAKYGWFVEDLLPVGVGIILGLLAYMGSADIIVGYLLSFLS